MELADIIAENLDGFMEAAGLNQVQVAEKSGLKQPVISRALNRKMFNPEIETIAALAKAVNRQPWELLRPHLAEESKPQPAPTVDALVKLISEQERRLEELAQKLHSGQNKRVSEIAEAYSAASPKTKQAVELILKPYLKAKLSAETG
jgi:transcriptional regulator with XRE-family HTH domain